MKTTGFGAIALATQPLLGNLHGHSLYGAQASDLPAFGLARSLHREGNYPPKIEGVIPREIDGTLYRNGPGLFDRNGVRKSNILDGDGMVQSFRFSDGKVHYRNRFVRTEKYLEEEKLGKFKYSTWSTRAPGGITKNWFMRGEMKSQAGVTVRIINGRLFAFDESNTPYELDPRTLETLGSTDFDVHFEKSKTLFAAHSKVDGQTGDWIQFGLENGPTAHIQVSVFDKSLKLKRNKRYKLPVSTYMHDFMVSQNHIIFNLQPAKMSPLPFVAGTASFTESLRWNPEKGSTFMVIHKSLSQKPQYFETDAVWMWHSLNSFEIGDEIVSYICGYDNPDHFIGDHPQTYEIMKPGAILDDIPNNQGVGNIRQVKLNLRTGKMEQQILNNDQDRTYEFPVINDQHACQENTIGYMASGHNMGALHHEISRVNIKTGKIQQYNFGKGYYCGEPIFVAKAGIRYDCQSDTEAGWLLTLVFDQKTDKSFLALMDTEHLTDGPQAKIWLEHHSPMSFHGHWHSNG